MHAIAQGGVRALQESLHRKFILGQKSFVAPGNRTCISGMPVRCSTNWATTPPIKPFVCFDLNVVVVRNLPFQSEERLSGSIHWTIKHMLPLPTWCPYSWSYLAVKYYQLMQKNTIKHNHFLKMNKANNRCKTEMFNEITWQRLPSVSIIQSWMFSNKMVPNRWCKDGWLTFKFLPVLLSHLRLFRTWWAGDDFFPLFQHVPVQLRKHWKYQEIQICCKFI